MLGNSDFAALTCSAPNEAVVIQFRRATVRNRGTPDIHPALSGMAGQRPALMNIRNAPLEYREQPVGEKQAALVVFLNSDMVFFGLWVLCSVGCLAQRA